MGPAIPLGAEQRLLPEWIPLTFFAFALVCLPLGWLLLFIQADGLNDFSGGFGPVLAALHMFTLGVLMTTIFGASMQMLPVATASDMNNPKAVVLLLLIALSGVTILLGGFAHYFSHVALLGASLLWGSALIYAAFLYRILRRAQNMALVKSHVFLGSCILMIISSLGLLMVVEWAGLYDIPMPHPALLHGGLALYGFMGLMTLGFSRIMIPMLAVSNQTRDKLSWATLAITTAALLLWIFNQPLFALISGFLAAGLYSGEMFYILKGRMRTRLGPEWHIIRFAWLCLPLSLLVILMGYLSQDATLFIQTGFVIAILGWLVSFIIGILQRIIPFLLSMQIARKIGMPELPSKLTHEKLLKVIGPLHMCAVGLLCMALLIENALIIRLASLCGLFAGLLFLTFFIIALQRKKRSLETMQS
ncbi:MAG: hypothetical protein HWE34_11655 [Methylocystaceae bacterium]|nr:hypothetical protein [Methylocystaceae bacterium]